MPTGLVDLLGVACGLGGVDPGCAEGPAALAEFGLERILRGRGVNAAWRPTLAPGPGTHSNRREISQLCRRLAAQVAESLRMNRFPCVLGGDHTIAAGTWGGAAAALRPDGPIGLIWIDAHMDSHTPQTSPTGRPHGMPLASLFGCGDGELHEPGAGALSPQHVCLVGVRSYEAEEASLLERLGVRIFFIEEIRRRGLAAVLDQALATVNRDTAGFGITIDLDALDPADAPGVALPVPDGIRAVALLEWLAANDGGGRLIALEIAEYFPRRDHDNRTAKLIAELIVAALIPKSTLSGV